MDTNKFKDKHISRIKQLMKEKHVTQSQLAKYLSATRQCISNYINGKHYMSAENLLALSDYFDVSVDYILGRSDLRNSNK